jgi:hypothetical protein
MRFVKYDRQSNWDRMCSLIISSASFWLLGMTAGPTDPAEEPSSAAA